MLRKTFLGVVKMDKIIDLLIKMPLFQNFSREELAYFMEQTDFSVSQYHKGSVIFMENEECTSFHILLEGAIQIQKIDPLGRVLTIVEFKPGDTLGENLLFAKTNSFPMTVFAKEYSTIFHLNKEAVIQLCQEDRLFLYEFLRLISDKAVTLSTKLKDITLKTIRQKICEFLLWKYSHQNKLTIDLHMSKKEWADKLGVQRPSLSRELIKMKQEGLLDYDKWSIVIKDLEKIKKNA